ncbi:MULTISPECIES: hypothetical protein [unclassified Streptomyces]|uniref:hypothetical protein n=2 Tax=Streptomyces TaxID=1883 RepID=UPI00069668E0|nr:MULTISPECIES: hypothetical protein [unclassified Streptomyces]ODA72728.1 hypothetical protein APS67_003027 [Streptomyces sp. AVP053U2]
MDHVEPAHLVELALGNGVSSDDVSALRHIAVCIRCRRELNRMTRVVAAARSVEEPDLPTGRPEQVWQRITQELSLAGEAAPPPPAGADHTLRVVPACEHCTGAPGDAVARTARLVLAVSVVAVVVRWLRRSRPAERSGRSG